jgi:hypothetical protein
VSQNINVVRQVNKLKNKIYLPRLTSAFQSTICFFHDTDNKPSKAAGSGILIKYKDSLYVVSAAHVLAEHFNDTYVILDDKELIIGGTSLSTPMPKSNNRNDDKLDISILKVDAQSRVDLLSRFKPIEINEIEINHKFVAAPNYFLVGYPLTRTWKDWESKKIKSIAYTYHSELFNNYNYTKFGFKDSTTIAIKYEGKVTNASIPTPHLSPKLTGLSGCGVWYFDNRNQKKLIGVVIERRTERGHSAILATKIDFVMGMIVKLKKYHKINQ